MVDFLFLFPLILDLMGSNLHEMDHIHLINFMMFPPLLHEGQVEIIYERFRLDFFFFLSPSSSSISPIGSSV